MVLKKRTNEEVPDFESLLITMYKDLCENNKTVKLIE